MIQEFQDFAKRVMEHQLNKFQYKRYIVSYSKLAKLKEYRRTKILRFIGYGLLLFVFFYSFAYVAEDLEDLDKMPFALLLLAISVIYQIVVPKFYTDCPDVYVVEDVLYYVKPLTRAEKKQFEKEEENYSNYVQAIFLNKDYEVYDTDNKIVLKGQGVEQYTNYRSIAQVDKSNRDKLNAMQREELVKKLTNDININSPKDIYISIDDIFTGLREDL